MAIVIGDNDDNVAMMIVRPPRTTHCCGSKKQNVGAVYRKYKDS